MAWYEDGNWHFHIRITPYELNCSVDNFFAQFESTARIAAHDEVSKQGQPHIHIYLVTTIREDTVRTRIQKGFNIPKTGRGQGNKYYALANSEIPINTDNLRKFTLGYTAKDERLKFCRGFTDQEIKDARDFYLGKSGYQGGTPETPISPTPPASEASATDDVIIRKERTVLDRFLQCEDYVLKDVNDMPDNLSIKHFRGPVMRWFRSKSPLVPECSTYKRFLVSIYLNYLDHKKIKYSDFHDDEIKYF